MKSLNLSNKYIFVYNAPSVNIPRHLSTHLTTRSPPPAIVNIHIHTRSHLTNIPDSHAHSTAHIMAVRIHILVHFYFFPLVYRCIFNLPITFTSKYFSFSIHSSQSSSLTRIHQRHLTLIHPTQKTLYKFTQQHPPNLHLTHIPYILTD